MEKQCTGEQLPQNLMQNQNQNIISNFGVLAKQKDKS